MRESITEANIAEMLKPLSENNPTAADLRENISSTSSYQVLRNARTNARNEERDAERMEQESAQVKPKDWLALLKTVPEVLIKESKDIELVAWYIEALTREHGFQGIAMGFSLARQLIEAYGEQLHPIPDEDGIVNSQLSSLLGLNGFGSAGTLLYPINMIELLRSDEKGPLATWHCEQILQGKSAEFTQEILDGALERATTEHLQALQSQIILAIEEYKKFQIVVDQYCENDQPAPTGKILSALEHSLKVLGYVAGDRLAVLEEESQDDENADTNEAEGVQLGKKAKATGGPISDREEALKRLREVASFFRRTEPHSPISYSIEQAVRWSSLPLTDLIKELIPDDGARKKYRSLSGIAEKTD